MFVFGVIRPLNFCQQGIHFSLDAPRREGGVGYEHMLMGEKLGTLTR